LGIFAQNSKVSNTGKKITPGQFLRTAQPVAANGEGGLVAASPKTGTNVYNLFGGNGMGTSLLRRQTPRETPTQFRMPAQPFNGGTGFNGFTTASPHAKHQTVINLFTQPVSCSNFYQSCGDNNS
jgi:hypothetical protein